MTIPEQAVEAAAQGIYDAYVLRHGLSDAPSWGQLSEFDKTGDRRDARAALEAAQPLMGVERASPPLRAREEIAALRELYEWYDRDGSVGAAADVFEKHRALLPAPPVAGTIVAEKSEVK